MKAYCINLDRRPDRRAHMWSEFNRLGIEVERVPAIDGSLPEIAGRTELLKAGVSGLRLGAGAYACFQSHRLCWQKLLESGDPCAMILEDDLLIADGFGDFLDDGWVPTDADIVKLETWDVRVHLGRKKVSIGSERYLGRLRSTHYGAGCYVISNAAAERVLQLTATVLDAVDEALFDARHEIFSTLQIYQMVPAPTIQGDRLLEGRVRGTWSQTSINLRFGPGESGNAIKETLPKRIRRRITEESLALLSGTRYTVVRHG